MIVTLEHPGAGLNLAIPKESVDTGLAVSGMSLKGFLTHTIPTSITEAMASNEILQIVVFSMFFGIAGASLERNSMPAGGGAQRGFPHYAEGDRVRDVRRAAGDFRRYLFGYRLAGLGILLNYASFIGGYYVAILLTSAVLLAVGYMVLKKEVFAC